MRIAVMGSGAVGGYYGARLAGVVPVTFIARGEHLAAIRRRGLRVRSELGDVRVEPADATDDPAQVGFVDYVLFAVKLYDTESAAAACRPLLAPHTAVVNLQNGVDGEDVLAAIVGREHVMGGAVYIPATIAAPGEIAHTGRLARVLFGELAGSGRALEERAEPLRAALEAAGVEAVASDRIEAEVWQKFIVLAAFSGLSALTRCPLGRMRGDPAVRELLLGAMREAMAVGRASGVTFPVEAAQRFEETLLRTMPDAMRASMLEDLERSRRLELPWLSGAVVRRGAALGVPTPIHTFIETALRLHVAGG